MTNLAVIGCGNVGSRHLQALTRLTGKITIHAVEPREQHRALAKQRIEEALQSGDRPELRWYSEILELPSNLTMDLSILSTLTTHRLEQLTEMLNRGHRYLIVEKPACQSADELNQMIKLCQAAGAKAWVNLVRRYFPFYESLQEILGDDSPIFLNVMGGGQGLGTVGIHYLDLFSWFTGSKEMHCSGEFLQNHLYPNKRGKDLCEFGGAIFAKSGDSVLSLSYLPDSAMPITVNVASNQRGLQINESSGAVEITHGTFPDIPAYRYIHVSEMTTSIANDILRNGSCKLPQLHETVNLHQELFRIFIRKVQTLTGQSIVKCPIS